jgi:CheY-like chemotaxis protein
MGLLWTFMGASSGYTIFAGTAEMLSGLLLPSLLPHRVAGRMDGNTLFRHLREDPELEFIPVMLLTARASSESHVQGLREGVDDYLW